MGRCLFTHKWAINTATRRGSHGFRETYVIPYRTCERCGAIEHGIYDGSLKHIVWEPLRESSDSTPRRSGFFRQTSSLLDRLAHSFGLR